MSRTAFLFPGQGAQTVGMMKALLETDPSASRWFDLAKTILGYDLLDLCLNGPKESLDATNISQPAIFVSSIAALESLRSQEPELCESVAMTAGLSLGEYTSLVFSGALRFEDGLAIVKERGEAMQAASNAEAGGMVSVLLLDIPTVQALVDEVATTHFVTIANYLCPGNTVISGSKAGCEAIEKLCVEKSGKAIRLSVAGAFHTHYMSPASDRLEAVLNKYTMLSPRIPVVSNVDGQAHAEPTEIKTLLAKQLVSPVQWESSMRKMLEAGIEQFVEIGPGKVLAGLLKRIQRKVECRNIGV